MGALDVFIDTAGFFALWDAGDALHRPALKLQAELTRRGRRFLTTEYVVDETVTLLLVRHSRKAALDFLETIDRSELLRLEWIDPARFHGTAAWFRKHADKEWSFTDCASFVVMRELRISDAFTSDRHFRQAGFAPLLRK